MLNAVRANSAALSREPADGVLEYHRAYCGKWGKSPRQINVVRRNHRITDVDALVHVVHSLTFAMNLHNWARASGFAVAVAGFWAMHNVHFASSSSCFLASASMSAICACPKATDAFAAADWAAGLAPTKSARLEASIDTAQRQNKAASSWKGSCGVSGAAQNSSIADAQDSM